LAGLVLDRYRDPKSDLATPRSLHTSHTREYQTLTETRYRLRFVNSFRSLARSWTFLALVLGSAHPTSGVFLFFSFLETSSVRLEVGREPLCHARQRVCTEAPEQQVVTRFRYFMVYFNFKI
jgi:hypothetical protein